MSALIDYQAAFDFAPIGLALSRERVMVDCNQALCEMFGASREVLVGQSFAVLYPSLQEYERTGARIAPLLGQDGKKGRYADDRLMKRMSGELFWCHVTGRALNPKKPHEAGIWSFEDLSALRPVKTDLTPREREVAAYLLDGLTAKQTAKNLQISHRTVEIYRARLMRKYKSHTTADLVHKLMAGS
jgi:PAS domain S-box-containing protein